MYTVHYYHARYSKSQRSYVLKALTGAVSWESGVVA